MSIASAYVATVGRIPVRNLWLLMLYASRLFRELPSTRRSAAEENPDDIPNLVAEILTRAVERRLRRNLSLEFDRRQADLARVRGRIDSLRTECRLLQQKGRVACSFDELTTDTPRNRFVKVALNQLHQRVNESELRRRCRITAAALERAGVGTDNSRDPVMRDSRSTVSAGRTNTEDRQMLAAAELALNLRLPTEDPGQSPLSAPDRDEVWVRKLFEGAVGGFYDTLLSPQGWSVRTGGVMRWQVESPTEGIQLILPNMKTDIVLQRPDTGSGSPASRVVIDTKFTNIVGLGQHGNTTLHSLPYISDLLLPQIPGTAGRPSVAHRVWDAAASLGWRGYRRICRDPRPQNKVCHGQSCNRQPGDTEKAARTGLGARLEMNLCRPCNLYG